MFSDLRPYPRTTSSSIPWAPELPAHWTVQRGKALFRRVEREPRSEDGVVTCFRDGVVTLRSHRRTTGFTESLKEIGYQGIRKGDLVIHAMDAFAGAAGVSDSDGKGTPVYSVCVPLGSAIPHYYAAVVREMARSSWIQALSRGVRERSTDFRFEMFATQQLPVPPAAEQAAIVKYLAHANARIDKAIASKRRLIALVDEEKQAVARDLLTSGSDEIGRIPGHWQSVITKRLCRITTGAEDSGNSVLDGEYPFFVRGREILRSSDYLFDAEAVMTPGDGQGGVGKVFHYYHGQFQAHQRVYVFLNFKGVRARYFYWYLSTFFRSYALAQSNTVTMESLRQPVLASFPVAFPSQREQLRLVEQIEAETSRMQNRVDVAQREIALLGEFRARLVADVVTGQADVRAIAASLPEIDPDSPTPDRLADGDQIVDAAMERSEV